MKQRLRKARLAERKVVALERQAAAEEKLVTAIVALSDTIASASARAKCLAVVEQIRDDKEKNEERKKEAKKEKKQEENQKKSARARFVKPTAEEVRAYVRSRGYHFDPEAFWNFYEAKGWTIGRSTRPMASWQSACDCWERRRHQADNPQSMPDAAQLERKARTDRLNDELAEFFREGGAQ